VATLAGLSFGLPLMAYAASIKEDKGQFALVMRFIVMPLFLFSGTFFPLDTLPLAVRWIGWISPIWHGTQLGRVFSYGYREPPVLTAVHITVPAALAVLGWVLTKRQFIRRLGQ
jgi:lipooligosaccharide transport system permease protein